MRKTWLKAQCVITLFFFVFMLFGVEMSLPVRAEAQGGGLDYGDIAVVKPAGTAAPSAVVPQPRPVVGELTSSSPVSVDPATITTSSSGNSSDGGFLSDPALDMNVVVLKEGVLKDTRQALTGKGKTQTTADAATSNVAGDNSTGAIPVNVTKTAVDGTVTTVRTAGKVEHWSNGDHLVVRDSGGRIMHSEKYAPPAAVSTPSSSAPKTTWQKVKDYATTPIEGGGKGSPAWDKGYRAGNEAPGKAVNAVKTGVKTVAGKVKGVFQRGETAPAATPTAPATQSTTPAPKLEHWSNGDRMVVRDGGGRIVSSTKVDATPAVQIETPAPATKTAPASSNTASPAPAKTSAPVKSTTTAATPTGTTTTPAPKLEHWSNGDRMVVRDSGGRIVTSSKVDAAAATTTATPTAKTTPTATSSTPPRRISGSETTTSAAPAASTSTSSPVSGTTATGTTTTPAPKLEHWSNGDRMVVRDVKGRLVSHTKVDAAAATTTGGAATTTTTGGTSTSTPAADGVTAQPQSARSRMADAYRKGYESGKQAPGKAVDAVKNGTGKVVDKVKNTFRRDKTAPTETTTSEASAAAATPAPPGRIREALGAGGSTLKSFFTPKTMILSAGVTVGFKIVEQIRKGEKVDVGKAVGHLASGQFLGGYTGAALGASAGTVVGHLMKGIPVVGPVLGSFAPFLLGGLGGSLGASLGDDLSNGRRPSLKEAWAQMDKGQLVAQSVGGLVGFTLGNMLLPGIGGVVGSIVGGIVAGKVLDLIRGKKDGGQDVVAITPGGAVLTDGNGSTDGRNSGNVVTHGNPISQGSASDYETMRSAYQRYSQLLANGQGNSAEAREALQIYRDAHARVQAAASSK